MSATRTSIELTSLRSSAAPEPQTPRDGDVEEPFPPRQASVVSVAAVPPTPSRTKLVVLTAYLASLNFMTSFSTGLLTVGIPTIAETFRLSDDLIAWPLAVFSLASGATLLLGGSLGDVVGPKTMTLLGSLFLGAATTACGLCQTSTQLIAFRALQGLACSMAIPSSMGIISTTFKNGSGRNIAFATLGMAQPLGWAAGLVLGGVLDQTLGWRSGFYLGGATAFVIAALGGFVIPATPAQDRPAASVWLRVIRDIDWVGLVLSSTSLVLVSYILGKMSQDPGSIKHGATLAALGTAVVLALLFVKWMNVQEARGRPALIPNSLWSKSVFTATSIIVILASGMLNGLELLTSLYFQKVQALSPIQASVRFLPNVCSGICISLMVGLFVHRAPAVWIVSTALIISAVSPLLMALARPTQPYWESAFFAQLLAPVSYDILFTIGILVISDVFPKRTQALAGGVFNTMAKIGTSFGLALSTLISSAVSRKYASVHGQQSSLSASLLSGYSAGYWMLFGTTLLAVAVGTVGLRKTGKVGTKQD